MSASRDTGPPRAGLLISRRAFYLTLPRISGIKLIRAGARIPNCTLAAVKR